MRSILKSLLVVFVTVSFAGRAEAARGKVVTKPAATHGKSFEATGRVSLHQGQPCAPQIMFDFRSGRMLVGMAARFTESRALTEAARGHLSVRVEGVWQRGKLSTCEYIDVTDVTVEKRFLGIFPQPPRAR